MKREAFALLLLAALILISAWNIDKARKLNMNIQAELNFSDEAAAAGNWHKAAEHSSKALAIWLKAENYTHIFIRHPEIDSCTDAFYQYIEAIDGREEKQTASRLAALRYHLDSISKMERISPGNIF